MFDFDAQIRISYLIRLDLSNLFHLTRQNKSNQFLKDVEFKNPKNSWSRRSTVWLVIRIYM